MQILAIPGTELTVANTRVKSLVGNARLLAAFRAANLPIIHIRHKEANPASSFPINRPGQPFKDDATPFDGETGIARRQNCAFVGTSLEQHLRICAPAPHRINRLIFTGVVIHNALDVTIRMAHCPGFDNWLPLDATTAMDVTDAKDRTFPAQDVFDLYAAVLAPEYCQLTDSNAVIKVLPGHSGFS